jgi:flagellar L-ring protein FlgH
MRITALLALALAACATHIAPYHAKVRRFDPGKYDSAPRARGASLYAEGDGLFEDQIAHRVGDVIVVRVDEADSASRNAGTELGRKGSTELGAPTALVGAVTGGADLAGLGSWSSESKFTGKGKTVRSGRVIATLPVRVRRVLPNGDLYVEGSKVVLIGNEEQHLYVSGVIRSEDILPDDSVPSGRIADAEIEYVGRGDIADQQRQGWLTRIVGAIWPF